MAVFGEDVEYITDYTSDADELEAAIDGLEMRDRDTYITDNLCDILTEWKQQDVACRNIIIFTDGEEKEPLRHANEELYYMLPDLGYPVYVVQCVETIKDTAAKNLSAIATMSKGRLLLTEFEGSDGGSEKTMGDEILSCIEEGRMGEREESATDPDEQAEEDSKDGALETDALMETGTSAAKEAGDDSAMFIASDKEDAPLTGYMSEHETEVSYAASETSPIIVSKKDAADSIGVAVVFPVVGVVFAVVFAVVIYFITHRNDRLVKRDKKALKRMGFDDEELLLEAKIAEDAEDVDCSTFRLCDEDTATRILAGEEDGYNIVLEDCSDPTRLYRAGGSESLVVGRSRGLCDIVIDHDDTISGRHCQLSVVDGKWYVKDLKSSNGTRVNSQKVFQELLLKNGDILKLGQSALQVRI